MSEATDDEYGSDEDGADDLTRREFVAAGTMAALGLTAMGCALTSQRFASPSSPPAALLPVRFRVNGDDRELTVEARSSLLDVLRERLGLTGAKKGCDHGQCGACTVHVEGRRIASCLMLAVQANGRAITTIEGLSNPDGALHPMQQAFIDHDALQCGYCTPGQIMAAVACVREGHARTPDEIREYMSGNVCRCGAYPGIVAAIGDAARRDVKA